MSFWNPWHGCTRVSPGCRHCWMMRRDAEHGRDGSVVARTQAFRLPLARDRRGRWKLSPADGTVVACLTSDFFHPAADAWRPEAWSMMRERADLDFLIITKRPERFHAGLPPDWGDGWDNVHLACTCENQAMAALRLPVLEALPLRRRSVVIEPMLGPVDLTPWLAARPRWLREVSGGGESGPEARVCSFDWVLDVRAQCAAHATAFSYHQTGARLVKDGRLYRIPRRLQEEQARRAGIDFTP